MISFLIVILLNTAVKWSVMQTKKIKCMKERRGRKKRFFFHNKYKLFMFIKFEDYPFTYCLMLGGNLYYSSINCSKTLFYGLKRDCFLFLIPSLALWSLQEFWKFFLVKSPSKYNKPKNEEFLFITLIALPLSDLLSCQ